MLDALIWKFSHSLLYDWEALDIWGCETLSCCQKKPPAFNIIFVNFATNYWWYWKKENPGVWLFGDLKGKYCYCLSAQPPMWKPRENRKNKNWAKIHFCWMKNSKRSSYKICGILKPKTWSLKNVKEHEIKTRVLELSWTIHFYF